MLRYSPEQMYNVVANVDQYQYFVPWCKKSRVMKGGNGHIWAELEIGFPPIVERYTSEVTVVPNHKVRVSLDSLSKQPLRITSHFLNITLFNFIKAHFSNFPFPFLLCFFTSMDFQVLIKPTHSKWAVLSGPKSHHAKHKQVLSHTVCAILISVYSFAIVQISGARTFSFG